MQVNAVDSTPVAQLNSVSKVSDALESLAKQHNTTIPELVKCAQAAGSAGAPYQIRALNLQARLDKLSAD